ncbi:MAG TPA: hypothetical protein VIC25_10540 [Caulobacteraceae bacterium]
MSSSSIPIGFAVGSGAAAVALVGLLRRRPSPASPNAPRRLGQASAAIAASVLADSALEHYRGSFANKAMYAPLLVSTAAIAASMAPMFQTSDSPSRARRLAFGAALLAGAAGTGFHAYNVIKRPGGLSLRTLFYGAPIGAPAALGLVGLFGLVGERLRGRGAAAGRSLGRMMARLSAVGLLGGAAEAGLLHFRGAFQNPLMVLPLTAPPAAAALLLVADSGPKSRLRARRALSAAAVIGLAGSFFHALGVARMMGGWRNWSQNLLAGPPLPAPPSFAGLALAGLAAIDMLDHG